METNVEQANSIVTYVSIPAAIVFIVGLGMVKSKNDKIGVPGAIISIISLVVLFVSLVVGAMKKNSAGKIYRKIFCLCNYTCHPITIHHS